MKKRRLKVKKLSIIFMLLVLVALGLLLLKIFSGKGVVEKIKEKVVEPKVQIIDLDSKSRPYAVMINNLNTARPYQSGLQDAYLMYEIIAEGGITRYLALFKDKETDRIGSVRSSRHYYLDYALENDAIYVHWGWSPKAKQQISDYNINNINGLTYEGTYFYRDTNLDVDYEHTGFTKMSMLKDAVKSLGYRTETEEKPLLNYSAKKVDLSKNENAIKADNIEIEYSDYITTSYEYDPENMLYKRLVNGEPHKDYVTGKQYTFKNIIIYQVNNYSIDSYGRQDLENLGTGEGYYISEGLAVPITWEKESKESKTIYKYSDGKELVVNDGNTFIQIQPKDKLLNITEKEVAEQ